MQGLENDRRGRFQMKLLGIAWLAMGVLYVIIIYLFCNAGATLHKKAGRLQVSAARFQELLRTLRLMKGAGSLGSLGEHEKLFSHIHT